MDAAVADLLQVGGSVRLHHYLGAIVPIVALGLDSSQGPLRQVVPAMALHRPASSTSL